MTALLRRLAPVALLASLVLTGATLVLVLGPATSAHPTGAQSETTLCAEGSLCLYPLEEFGGTPIVLKADTLRSVEGHTCHSLRVLVRSAINLSPHPVRLFARTDCTGNHVHLKAKAKVGTFKVAVHALVFLT